MTRDVWEGPEWQKHCVALLSMKHDTNIQFVPDRTDGDHGIEAFRLDEGTVYQCYSPAEYFTTKSQTAAQKKKITDDLRKLYEYRQGLMDMLGVGYRIERWVLLTPYIDDKELVKHARKKSDEVRTGADRPDWWTNTFRVAVFTDEDHFPEELRRLYASADELTFRTPIPDAIDEAESTLQKFDERLGEKLIKSPTLAADTDRMTRIKNSLLLEYVIGQVRVDELERKYSEVWQKVNRRSKSYLRAYQRDFANGPSMGDPSRRLADGLADKLRQDAPALPSDVCDELAWHFVASWWIQCPLSYSASAS